MALTPCARRCGRTLHVSGAVNRPVTLVTVGGSSRLGAGTRLNAGRMVLNAWSRYYLADACGPFPQAYSAWQLGGRTISYTVDLSNAGCGCNAAVYLVSMPQNTDATTCHDHYCDANSVCGVSCAEIDLMEANKVAFVSTVHVRDDPSGEGFGIAHYVGPNEKRLVSSRGDDCPYGPRESCTIDTNRPFSATFRFSAAGAPFECARALSDSPAARCFLHGPTSDHCF